MDYSSSHIREVVGIPQETLRHWRKVFAPISKRNGWHSFTLGDALALLIIKELSSYFGIQVNSLAPYASTLFDLCHVIRWNNYKNKVLLYNPKQSGFSIVIHDLVSDSPIPYIVIDIHKHIIELNCKVLGTTDVDQLEIMFPPRLVSGRSH